MVRMWVRLLVVRGPHSTCTAHAHARRRRTRVWPIAVMDVTPVAMTGRATHPRGHATNDIRCGHGHAHAHSPIGPHAHGRIQVSHGTTAHVGLLTGYPSSYASWSHRGALAGLLKVMVLLLRLSMGGALLTLGGLLGVWIVGQTGRIGGKGLHVKPLVREGALGCETLAWVQDQQTVDKIR